jgi:ribosomal protein L37AE/L43A
MKTFKSILEFQKEFSSEEKCREYLEQQRWNGTPACPFCGSLNVHRFPNGKIFKCREKQCRNKFSVTVGTIYENTKIPLSKWFRGFNYQECHFVLEFKVGEKKFLFNFHELASSIVSTKFLYYFYTIYLPEITSNATSLL